ncbi:hypothetical protein PILCRDRAFT_812627 [Piloderma croceum F 1598]|uniref:Uncharacterized protein n=1 Tax=Piloderma croceum (strain F 1598) TaxID=765440 RepID=A0A0C3G0U0_PILCF|nr:hypothetical protein PILCRDRAFT_812627 [Piloderma croceum F 1598]
MFAPPPFFFFRFRFLVFWFRVLDLAVNYDLGFSFVERGRSIDMIERCMHAGL